MYSILILPFKLIENLDTNMARPFVHVNPLLKLVHFVIISFVHSVGTENQTDLMALLDFKNRIIDDPLGIMASWNDSSHHCNWTGIACHPLNSRVQLLNLTSTRLVGSLPPSIGNLSFLEILLLGGNNFHGEIPQEIGQLSVLKSLNLTHNMFSGSIPSNLSNCTELTSLALEFNQLSGLIPGQFTSLSNLEVFAVGHNSLTGSFPAWIGNLSSRFSTLTLSLNSFNGSIPPGIGRLSGMTSFKVGGNQFSGELPSSIYNLSSMVFFFVAENRLQGKFPADIGIKYPNLEKISVGANNFTGEIPVSLVNATRLALIDFGDNSLTGTVPSDLGRLSFLNWINFDTNFLGNQQGGDLDFLSSLTNCSNLEQLTLINNSFVGELPSTIANLSAKLWFLRIGNSPIRGSLPAGIVNLEGLRELTIGVSSITGAIPDDIGKLSRLNKLYLATNALTGTIPPSLGNLTSLIKLNLEDNMLQGIIPPQLGNCTRLFYLNISNNSLTGSIPREVMSLSSLTFTLSLAGNSFSGPLPVEVGNLVNLKRLEVNENNLSGEIPSSLGSCISLMFLIMGGNGFMGTIPQSLGALRGLEEIDFSYNNLTGRIPDFLGRLPIYTLDLSYNYLEGEVPNQGIFSKARAVSVVGNEHLCGGAPRLKLPDCPRPKRMLHKLRWILALTVSVTVIMVLTCVLSLWYILRKPKKQDNTASLRDDLHLVISYRELHRATSGFSADNLIGSGSFGSVYKGVLGENASSIAVKVLTLEQRGAIQSFVDECTIHRSIRHRNLLKIITVCSGYDPQGQDFKCLVTEFMAKGSLDAWLHPRRDSRSIFRTRTLNIKERLTIAIDIATAVDYLHNHSHTPIIHCDLKPSNILLDEDLIAHVGDFGLAKFLLQSASRPLQNDSMSVELRGSIGYIPPEYGTSTQISTLGDVYSYGILLLEMFTGKRPTDDMFHNDRSIHNYVAMALQNHGSLEVLDPTLILREEEERETHEAGEITEVIEQLNSREMECLVSVLKIGVSCSMSLAEDRMSIGTTLNQLQAIRSRLNASN